MNLSFTLSPFRWMRKTWRDSSESIKRLVVVLWAAAVLVLLAGLFGEHIKWWADKPFLTNLASSFTGALFGIPLALLVLQEILRAEEDRHEQLSAMRAAQDAADAALQSFVGIFQTWPDLTTVRELVEDPAAASLAHREQLVRQDWVRLCEGWSRAFSSDPQVWRRANEDARSRLRVLTEYMHPRLVEVGMPGVNLRAASNVDSADQEFHQQVLKSIHMIREALPDAERDPKEALMRSSITPVGLGRGPASVAWVLGQIVLVCKSLDVNTQAANYGYAMFLDGGYLHHLLEFETYEAVFAA